MADVVSTLPGWSATAASNAPAGGTAIGTGLDDNLREIQAVIRKYLASPGANMASAGTVDLSTADGFHIHITGTTTITALGTVSAGIYYLLEFDGALTFTHNGTTLDLPGDANITTVAGDMALMLSKGSGNWKCVYYTRASGYSIAAAPSVTVANEAADTTCFPLFVTAATGDLAPKTNAALAFNSSTGALTLTGDLSAPTVSGSMVATQANQETASSTTTLVSPGRQQFHPSALKGWLKCDVAGNVDASYNVTSISDVADGVVEVTWATDFSGTNYYIGVSIETSVALACRIANGTPTAGVTRVHAYTVDTPALTDPTKYYVAVSGDQ